MQSDSTPTCKDAVNFYLQHRGDIDADAMAKDLLLENFSQMISLMEINVSAVLGKVAKSNPALFMRLAVRHATRTSTAKEVAEALASSNAIAAIRTIRRVYDLSLRDAKDVCDNLREMMKQNGCNVTSNGAYSLKNPVAVNAFNQLREFILAEMV
jgi:ribosomal protein L7/L12